MKRRRKHQEALTATELADLLADPNITAATREMLCRSLAAFEAMQGTDANSADDRAANGEKD